MTDDHAPLRHQLRVPPLDEARAATIVATARARGRRGPPPPSRFDPRLVTGVGIALAMSVLGAAFWVLTHRIESSGPLHTTEGRVFERVVVEPETEPASVSFEDGSRLTARPGAVITALESSRTRQAFLLETGEIDLAVEPDGPRRWVIEAGLARVEVVGTRLYVGRIDDRVEVVVEEGVVLVHSSHLPNGVRRLEAGRRVIVRPEAKRRLEDAPPVGSGNESSASTERGGPPIVERDPDERAVEIAPPRRRRAPPAAPPAGRQPARAENPTPAEPASLDAQPFRSDLDVAARLDEVDRLRRESRPAEAETLLRAIGADERVSTSARALAEFTRGRLLLDDLDRPAEAAGAFAAALELGLPTTLERSARSRLVQASSLVDRPADQRDDPATVRGDDVRNDSSPLRP